MKEWTEITEDQYMEALEVLPPEKWMSNSGVSFFRMCEYNYGDMTAHYAQIGKRYFTAERSIFDKYVDLAREIKEVAK